jgi:hypothetical protein
MIKFFIVLIAIVSLPAMAQSSMRRCTLLPITDSVGGAIGYKVFEEIERELKKSNWCTYVSNSGLINVFSRYRENLPQYLKTKEVLATVAEKLKVGSLIRVGLVNEVKGLEVQLEVYGENGEDLFFSEKTLLQSDDIEMISSTVENWLDTYAKTIPYDATVTGILGDQITLDVGKGYPIQIGQKFLVKRLMAKKKHPLLKKIVDWDTKLLAEGSVFNISDNQALGMIKIYKDDQKLVPGDWVRLEEFQGNEIKESDLKKDEEEKLGTLGLLSVALFGSSSSVDTSTPSGSNRWGGQLYGIDLRGEAWITRQYFAALEIMRSLGSLKSSSGNPSKSSPNVNNGLLKLTGGYKYLPIGFFYGPQIDLYGGYASKTFDVDYSGVDGIGKNSISGFILGVGANIPINREFKFFTKADFMPFPTFKDDDKIYGTAKSASSLDLEIGVKYQYTLRMTLDASIESRSSKAKFNSGFKEVSYKDNILKLGTTFNF